jgi:hypothetical protein
MASEKLLPCPFCGGDVFINETVVQWGGPKGYQERYWIDHNETVL